MSSSHSHGSRYKHDWLRSRSPVWKTPAWANRPHTRMERNSINTNNYNNYNNYNNGSNKTNNLNISNNKNNNNNIETSLTQTSSNTAAAPALNSLAALLAAAVVRGKPALNSNTNSMNSMDLAPKCKRRRLNQLNTNSDFVPSRKLNSKEIEIFAYIKGFSPNMILEAFLELNGIPFIWFHQNPKMRVTRIKPKVRFRPRFYLENKENVYINNNHPNGMPLDWNDACIQKIIKDIEKNKKQNPNISNITNIMNHTDTMTNKYNENNENNGNSESNATNANIQSENHARDNNTANGHRKNDKNEIDDEASFISETNENNNEHDIEMQDLNVSNTSQSNTEETGQEEQRSVLMELSKEEWQARSTNPILNEKNETRNDKNANGNGKERDKNKELERLKLKLKHRHSVAITMHPKQTTHSENDDIVETSKLKQNENEANTNTNTNTKTGIENDETTITKTNEKEIYYDENGNAMVRRRILRKKEKIKKKRKHRDESKNAITNENDTNNNELQKQKKKRKKYKVIRRIQPLSVPDFPVPKRPTKWIFEANTPSELELFDALIRFWLTSKRMFEFSVETTYGPIDSPSYFKFITFACVKFGTLLQEKLMFEFLKQIDLKVVPRQTFCSLVPRMSQRVALNTNKEVNDNNNQSEKQMDENDDFDGLILSLTQELSEIGQFANEICKENAFVNDVYNDINSKQYLESVFTLRKYNNLNNEFNQSEFHLNENNQNNFIDKKDIENEITQIKQKSNDKKFIEQLRDKLSEISLEFQEKSYMEAAKEEEILREFDELEKGLRQKTATVAKYSNFGLNNININNAINNNNNYNVAASDRDNLNEISIDKNNFNEKNGGKRTLDSLLRKEIENENEETVRLDKFLKLNNNQNICDAIGVIARGDFANDGNVMNFVDTPTRSIMFIKNFIQATQLEQALNKNNQNNQNYINYNENDYVNEFQFGNFDNLENDIEMERSNDNYQSKFGSARNSLGGFANFSNFGHFANNFENNDTNQSNYNNTGNLDNDVDMH